MPLKPNDTAQISQGTSIYKASDEPTVIGQAEAGTKVQVVMGPHMGKMMVKFLNTGQSGWVSNGSLKKA